MAMAYHDPKRGSLMTNNRNGEGISANSATGRDETVQTERIDWSATGVPAPGEAPLRERGSVFTDEITMDFADACRTAAEAGLRYVDIRKVWGVFSHEVPRGRWSEMASILRDHGLRIGAIQSNFGKCSISGPEYDAHIAFFPTLVEQAHFFGTDVIRVFPFWSDVRMTDEVRQSGAIRPNLEGVLAELVRRFRPAADLARREGMRLGFEPEHSTYSGSPQEVARIVEAVDTPNVGVAWDVNNGWDECSVEDAYALFRGRVWNVHVKERALTPQEHRAVAGVLGRLDRGRQAEGGIPERTAGSSTVTGPQAPPPDAAARLRRQPTLLGTGALPWRQVVALLEQDGYRGLYSIETHFGVRGRYGWPKLKAATTYFIYALREILEEAAS
jgi:sugar phosphate isomerase/epimerase